MQRHSLWVSAAIAALIAVSGLAVQSPALAGDTLLFAPPQAWIRPVPVHTAMPVEASDPVAVLNLDTQLRLAPGPDLQYFEIAMRIQTPQGLSDMQPRLSWNPETETVTVHRVHILRDGQVIDLLAQGHTFTILRREMNLDQSMLDGRLTAVLQPEGLRVGDILVYAATTERDDPVARDMSEAITTGSSEMKVGRLTHRATWPKSLPVRWRTTADLKPVVTDTAHGREFVIDATGYKAPEAPERAPWRFRRSGVIELSQYASWEELSAMMTPLYQKAAILAPDSPVRAEAARIRALSNDPKVQAAEALSLVQDNVRYVFIGANLGNYTPADADLSWTRRFGDCKGKSVLLVALLRELGIEADPALVQTSSYDGMDERLPMMRMFDHVIVRARIDGKTYWLDGTRSGDGGLDVIPVPTYKWALPLTDAGAGLEAIVVPLPQIPLSQRSWHIDARSGLDAPAPFRIETVLRGEAGLDRHSEFLSMTADKIDEELRKRWKSEDWLTITATSQTWDPTTGELRMIVEGTAKMEWEVTQAGKPRRYEIDGHGTVGDFDLKRKSGPNADAPVTLAYPYFAVDRETILLPRGGKGFSIIGESVDTTLGGMEVRRSLSLRDGAFTMDKSTRTLTGEVPLDRVRKDDPELKRLSDTSVYLQAPYNYTATEADVEAAQSAEPKTVDDFLLRAGRLAEAEQFDKALADANAAIALDPKSSAALVVRGSIKADMNDTEGALADYAAALKLNPRDTKALYGRALIYSDKTEDYPKAIEAVTRILDITPADSLARRMRAGLFLLQDDNERALDDALTVAAMEPDSSEAARFLAEVYALVDRRDDAIATLRDAVKKSPDDAEAHAQLAGLLSHCGELTGDACDAQRREAVAAYDAAIALTPTSALLAARAFARPDSDRAAAFADLEQALAREPDDSQLQLMRAELHLDDKAYALAMADVDAILAREPGNADALSTRGRILEAQGDIDGYIAAMDAAVTARPDSAQDLNNACWARASHNRDLDKAMALCDAALKLEPESGATLDSRAMIHLQAGRWEAAVTDYDAAMKAGEFASALYGRGIAKLRLGRTKEGQADLAAARKAYPDIDKTYAGHGIKP